MIIGTLNIRGGCSKIKRKRISRIIKKWQANIFMLLETKMVEILELIANSFWGAKILATLSKLQRDQRVNC